MSFAQFIMVAPIHTLKQLGKSLNIFEKLFHICILNCTQKGRRSASGTLHVVRHV